MDGQTQTDTMRSHSDELAEYHSLITDVWHYFRNNTEKAPRTDQDWIELIDSGNQIAERHGSIQDFATKLILAAMSEIERRARLQENST